MKYIALLISTLVLLMSCISQAHQDTPVKLEDGKISGLPEKYQPATFDRENKILTIAGKRLVFPKVLHALFTDDRVDWVFGERQAIKGHPYELKFSASWYHDTTGGLPPYMLIRIEPKDRDYAFELLIDMDSLSFIKATAQIATVGPIPIDLDGVVDSSLQTAGEAGTDQSAAAPKPKTETEGKEKLEPESKPHLR